MSKIINFKINLDRPEAASVKAVINFFKEGKVIVSPTDTIYGLSCLATNRAAVNRIYRIKKRNLAKPCLVLVSSFAMLKKYCRVNRQQIEWLHSAWPGPVTVILAGRPGLSPRLYDREGGLAVRLPQNDFLIKIINSLHAPLVSTSANLSGRKNLFNPIDYSGYFAPAQPDAIVDAGAPRKRKSSRVVDLRDIDNIKILRN